jgi:N-acetyl-beta-hexosaminidase
MAPTSHTYFDYRQARQEKGFGGSVLPLEEVYRFEPIPAELNAEQAHHILGGQGQLWGELIKDEQYREYMTYPRACALIETLWSPRQPRDFRQFHERLTHHLRRLDAAGINYRRLDPLVRTENSVRGPQGERRVSGGVICDNYQMTDSGAKARPRRCSRLGYRTTLSRWS